MDCSTIAGSVPPQEQAIRIFNVVTACKFTWEYIVLSGYAHGSF